MIWANIDSNNIKINRPFSIPALNVNETYPVEFKEKVRIEGTCIFYFFNNNEGEFYASDGEEIELYNEKSRFFVNSIFHAVRVQSKEEKYQFLSNYIAAGSLVMIVIIEIIKALFLGNS
jgi:ADP-dependent phosphofructokinase/glucokinase